MNRGGFYKAVFTNPFGIRALLWSKLPLAAFAGLRVARLDESGAEVTLPAGWKTQNPFGSTYFAAQAMAAELSTGAPALWFIEQSGAPVSSLVTAISARFTQEGHLEGELRLRRRRRHARGDRSGGEDGGAGRLHRPVDRNARGRHAGGRVHRRVELQ